MSIEYVQTDEERIEELERSLRGQLLLPDDDGYHEARQVWNAMIDRRPALVVQCAGPADVQAAVNYARETDQLVSVKSGGHNIAGTAVGEDAVMLDLSGMNSVRVDPDARTVRVEPGAVLNELDHETQAHGLAVPVGYNSTTGIAGLALGGGFGWLSRTYGLTCDNLLSADVVTAAGELVHASAEENEDLFWGLRGGGGNFGVVTSFEFQLHEVGPELLAGLLVHPFEDTQSVLTAYREFVADAPDEATVWFVIRDAPPLEFLPEEWHGERVLILAACYAGDMSDGERVLQPLRDIGDPIADVVGPHRYTEWQQAFDPLGSEGVRNYWKSHNFEALTDEIIETYVEYGERLPSADSEIACAQLGGAINDVDVAATAYPHRNAKFLMNLHTRWEDRERDDECIEWTREFHEAMTPHATGGVYVNFLPETDGAAQAAYRENYERMVDLKTTWDPENRFRLNHNVEPATDDRSM
ncbi:FAD-binding oxidoreductase [Haloarchaeobius salinus]|uniref:FAD-binding oxidoreductase n=1 Tax=Haloarchaeobius salinus TaxID=1198298 RepID=UPI00210AE54A|nr:FAD-binding oxidoreductase [Haloarchaeobius salinus]